MARDRCYIFTIHSLNEGDVPVSGIRTLAELKAHAEDVTIFKSMTYFVAGLELGEETKRWHWQGFCRFKNARGRDSAKKAISKIVFKYEGKKKKKKKKKKKNNYFFKKKLGERKN